jgi:tetratricopeptide (TPR) repeat protein
MNVFSQDNLEFPYEFISICGDMYYEFNKNNGPDVNMLNETIKNLQKCASEENLMYNDLYVSLLNSIIYVNSRTDYALKSIVNLMDLAINKYNMYFASPYWHLILGEILIRYGDYEKALGEFIIMKELHLSKISFDSEDEKRLLRVLYSEEPTRLADFYIAYCTDEINTTNVNMEGFKKMYYDFWRIKE